MRTTVTIDDDMYQEALDFADPGTDKNDLFRDAIATFIRVQAARRLAMLGGATPAMKDIPRQTRPGAQDA